MSSHHVPIPYLDWGEENKQKSFLEWKDFMQSYFVIQNISNDNKYHYILLSTGTKGRDLLQASDLSEADKKKPDLIWKVFEDFLVEKPNKWVQRIELQAQCQGSSETAEAFIMRLKNKTAKCSFSNEAIQEDRLLEQLIKGCKYQEVRRQLIGKGDHLNLPIAVTLLKSHEASVRDVTEYSTASSTAHGELQSARPVELDSIAKVKRKTSICNKCGLKHEPRKCPAYGSVCNICKKPNHWAKVCRSKIENQFQKQNHSYKSVINVKPTKAKYNRHPQRTKVHDLVIADTDDSDQFNIDTLSDSKDSRDEIFTRIAINVPEKRHKVHLKVKVDTGANANVMTMRSLRQIYPEKFTGTTPNLDTILAATKSTLSGYGGSVIQQIGCITVYCNGKNLSFFVVESDSPNILGLDACRDLNLIKINCAITANNLNTNQELSIDKLKDKYPECFDTVGTFQGEFHITLKENASPVIHPPRKCPIHVKHELLQGLNEMIDLGIIEAVEKPTDWVNSLAFSRKSNGKLRICLDPRDLNKAIKREHYKTPTLEELSHKFAGAKVFSKLDAQHGYWAVKLDKESSLMTTFNSPFGRFKFLRLPFGLSVSQDVFQKKMDQILDLCPGTVGISDDVCVYGSNKEEHDKNLLHLMKVAQQKGLVFNSKKCAISKDRITFFGLQWSSNGVQPDIEKCDNIKNKVSPTNKTELQSFLGLIQYLSPFIPRLSERTATFRELLKKDSVWQWTESHERLYQKMKDDIHHHLLLSYFNPQEETTLEVDSSLNGLGAALLQNGKPIAFASKSLSDTEKRYANIEREMLAVVFACERFHTYIYGKEVTIQSDHKPLESIQLKNIAKAPPRLQRMLLRIQQYQCHIQYKPGKEMVFADFLSRNKPTTGEEIQLDSTIHYVMISDQRKAELQGETLNDAQLACLIQQVTKGWPETIDQISKIIRPYWAIRDLLSIDDGLILKGTAIIIPKSMQKLTLEKIHVGHQGREKCQSLAKENVFWFGITKDIERVVRECEICNKYARNQTKQPLLQPELPKRPFEKLAADIFHFEGKNFLLLADYYSKMPFVKALKSMTSQETVKYIASVFAIHGIPKTLITDNAKQFTCTEFNNFAKEWDFKHITSSPYHPKSNGFIERMVQTVKLCLKKAKDSQQNPQIALLNLRTTPINSSIPSPAEMLFNRDIRTLLPRVARHNLNKTEQIQQRMRQQQVRQKEYYDRTSRRIPPLAEHQPVFTQNPIEGTWEPATVISPASEPRSYIVKTPNGAVIRRNRIHLKERTANTEPDDSDPFTTEVQENTSNNDIITTSSEFEPVDKCYQTRYGRRINRPSRYS